MRTCVYGRYAPEKVFSLVSAVLFVCLLSQVYKSSSFWVINVIRVRVCFIVLVPT